MLSASPVHPPPHHVRQRILGHINFTDYATQYVEMLADAGDGTQAKDKLANT